MFVHGLLVDSRLWDGVVERLADGHRCIVADWPMGSHRPAMNDDADLTPPGLARIIALLMDELGIERATIVGNDTGGAVSQILAANHPERVERLVLTNCDTFEHFPPFPFNLLPMVARLPGGLSVLQAPQRFAAVRRMGFAPLVKRPLSQELVDSWLEPAGSDPAIKRDLRQDPARHPQAPHARGRGEAARRSSGRSASRGARTTASSSARTRSASPRSSRTRGSRTSPERGTFVPLDEPAQGRRAGGGVRRGGRTGQSLGLTRPADCGRMSAVGDRHAAGLTAAGRRSVVVLLALASVAALPGPAEAAEGDLTFLQSLTDGAGGVDGLLGANAGRRSHRTARTSTSPVASTIRSPSSSATRSAAC